MSTTVTAPAGGRRVEVGAQVVYDGRTWQVTGLVEGVVRLAAGDGATASVLAAPLVADPGFRVVGAAVPPVPSQALFETVPLREQERALAWLRHLREVESGRPGGPGGSDMVRPEYDPQRFTLAEREQAKARELAALGWSRVSRTTVQRMRLVYRREGLWGLVDKRTRRTASPTGRTDQRVVAAVLEALRRRRGRRRGTVKQVIECAEQILADAHGPGRVPLPARSSLYRLVHTLSDPAEQPGRAARTATGPARSPAPAPALRPGERVHIAAARLGVQAVGDDGRAAGVAVTAALDGATGCVLACVLHPHDADAVDLSVLLAEMAVPGPLRTGWPTALESAHTSVPPPRLLSLDARLEHAAARAAAVPETLVFDRAAVTVTAAFLTVCESIGISLEGAPPRRPGTEPAAARTLHTLAGLFARHATATAAAALGPGGGRAGTSGAYWSVPQLQDLLDEWITAVWHHRPQEHLHHPVLPRAALTPDEMWGVLLGTAGYVPLPLTAGDFAELLPVRWTAVTERGIRLDRRMYDHPCLDEHRGLPSPAGVRDGKWEVHHHPHDVRQIFVRLPDGQLHEVPWIHRGHAARPFDESARHLTGQAIARRDGSPGHDVDPPDALLRLRQAAGAAPGRTVGRLKAAALPLPRAGAGPAAADDGSGRRPDAVWPGGDSLDEAEEAAVRADEGAGGFAVYDAWQEAGQW